MGNGEKELTAVKDHVLSVDAFDSHQEAVTMDEATYHRLLDTFLPSEEMRAYLKTQPMLPDNVLLDLIIGAPVPLTEKAKWAWGDFKRSAEEALSELTLHPGELFILNDRWYDTENHEEQERFHGPFVSFASVLARIQMQSHARENDAAWSGDKWYRLEKWVPKERHDLTWMEWRYSWWLVGDQIVFFDRESDMFFPCGANPNLPVPFQVGDLLTIDCRPFAPVKHALLLERGDNRECCCLQSLCRDEKTDLWLTGAVKHSSLFVSWIDPMYTPIYRLSRFTGELPPEEKLLRTVQRAIGGDERKGRWIQERMDSFEGSNHDLVPPALTGRELRRLAKEAREIEPQELDGPLVGPFFSIAGQLLMDGVPLYAARQQADKLDNPRDHEMLFDHYRRSGDYIDFPRGRVIWDRTNNRGIIYIDPCIRSQAEEIARRFRLKTYVVEEDEHYHCKNCANTILNEEWDNWRKRI